MTKFIIKDLVENKYLAVDWSEIPDNQRFLSDEIGWAYTFETEEEAESFLTHWDYDGYFQTIKILSL